MATKKRRGRPKKSALNQKKETKVSVSEKDVEKVKELHDIDLVDELKETASEEFDVPEEKVKVDIVPEEPEETEPEQPEETPEEIVEEKETPEEIVEEKEENDIKPRPMSEWSPAELRRFQRTGRKPE